MGGSQKWLYMHIYIYKSYLQIYTGTHIHIHTRTHAHTHTNTRTHTQTHMSVAIADYMYQFGWLNAHRQNRAIILHIYFHLHIARAVATLWTVPLVVARKRLDMR